MKATRLLMSMPLALLMVIGLVSCKKATPVARFSFTANGKTVTFVNESTDATTYEWDFGDGTTSTEQSPVKVYADYGLYSVSLNATGEGGENITIVEVEVAFAPSMVIDGDFSKWSSVPVFVAGDGGTITRVKVSHDEKYMYVYVEGTGNFRGFFDVYMDGDNNSQTGAKSWIYPAGAGAEYLLEGFIGEVGDADLFMDNPNTEDWCWTADCASVPVPAVSMGSGLIKASALKVINGGKAIEFSLMRAMATQLGPIIHLGFIDLAEDWSMQGGLPVIGGATSALLEYKFN